MLEKVLIKRLNALGFEEENPLKLTRGNLYGTTRPRAAALVQLGLSKSVNINEWRAFLNERYSELGIKELPPKVIPVKVRKKMGPKTPLPQIASELGLSGLNANVISRYLSGRQTPHRSVLVDLGINYDSLNKKQQREAWCVLLIEKLKEKGMQKHVKKVEENLQICLSTKSKRPVKMQYRCVFDELAGKFGWHSATRMQREIASLRKLLLGGFLAHSVTMDRVSEALGCPKSVLKEPNGFTGWLDSQLEILKKEKA